MKAYALLGGPKKEWPKEIKQIFQNAAHQGDLIIGVDRGSLLLEEMGIIPDLAMGDFDSLHANELSEIESNVSDIRYSNPVKDLTDSELMIQTAFLDYQVTDLKIYGATGGRLDHFLVNLLMLLNPAVRRFAEKVTLVDCQNEIHYYLPGTHFVKQVSVYPYFGVASLTACKHLNISGAKYALQDFNSSYLRVFSSNEFKQEQNTFTLSFEQGIVAVIFSKDDQRFDNLN